MKDSLFSWGDVNAFFALFIDNTVNLVILVGILAGVFGFPLDFALTKMVPGTALGVMIGDLAYTYLALKLSKETNNLDVTAMPLGLDTPSTIGIATTVIGPFYLQTHSPELAWAAGIAVMLTMGIIKLFMSFFGDAITRIIPKSGLLGPLGGIGLALLAMIPMLDIFEYPLAGMLGLGVVLYGLISRKKMPLSIPAAALGVVVALAGYWIGGLAGLYSVQLPHTPITISIPMPTLIFMKVLDKVPQLLTIALPFGLLTIVGGINVTESARAANDNYKTRDILMIEAFATIIAGLFGGVAQSTPYIGHPAYKRMGARSGYTLYTALAIGIGGMTGLLQWIIALLPKVTVAPILLFVGIEIAVQSVQAVKKDEIQAVFFSMVPVMAYLVSIYGNQVLANTSIPVQLKHTLLTMHVLGGGFILTGMLWGAIVSYIIQERRDAAVITAVVLGLLTAFGLIHSFDIHGASYLPWKFSQPLRPLLLAISYLILGLELYILIPSKRIIQHKNN